MKQHFIQFILCGLVLVLQSGQSLGQHGYDSGIKWLEPPVVTPGKTDSQPPSDAIVLFDGTDLAAWEGAEKWKIEDGELVVGKGCIDTKREFGDCQLHVEWSAPDQPDRHGHRRGNSGVKLLQKFEIQILNSFQNPAAFDVQAAAVYKQTPPMVNAMRPSNQWNTFDIFWTSPKFKEDGTLQQSAYVTIVHNGVLVANHFELKGATAHGKAPHYIPGLTRAPIQIQDHGSPIRFRNIWVRETSPAAIAENNQSKENAK